MKNIYIFINLLGIGINIVSISIILNVLDFETKSFLSVFIWAFIGYFIKTWIFTLPLRRLEKFNYKEEFGFKIVYSLYPFILMVVWFALIVLFQIEFLYFDYSFGYLQRFPHGLVQILTMLIMSLLSILILMLKRRKIYNSTTHVNKNNNKGE